MPWINWINISDKHSEFPGFSWPLYIKKQKGDIKLREIVDPF